MEEENLHPWLNGNSSDKGTSATECDAANGDGDKENMPAINVYY